MAEKHCPEAVPEIYVGQARVAFEQEDYAKAESYLLRAQKPEIIVKSYRVHNPAFEITTNPTYHDK